MVSIPRELPDVYRFVRELEPAVVAEFPMTEPGRLPGHDATYEFWSTSHWKPLVNGHSGYASERFIGLLDRMLDFPSDATVADLRALNVGYVIVHEAHYVPADFVDLAERLGRRPELQPLGRFRDTDGWARVFQLGERDRLLER